jgi:hypothetical protein
MSERLTTPAAFMPNRPCDQAVVAVVGVAACAAAFACVAVVACVAAGRAAVAALGAAAAQQVAKAAAAASGRSLFIGVDLTSEGVNIRSGSNSQSLSCPDIQP